MEEIESTLLMAIIGVESLHGESQARLDARYYLDKRRRVCVIDADSPTGHDLNKLFLGYLSREFCEDVFQVRRIVGNQNELAPEAVS